MVYFGRLLSVGLATSVSVLTLFACGDDSGEGGAGGTGGSGADEGGVCIKNNCRENEHCKGCEEGKKTCRIEAGEEYGRCVACGEGTSGSCPEGYECSQWGDCIPEGLTCPTDPNGVPQITCSNSGDCAACDPAHRVCDNGACVACSATDTSECQSTDICKDGLCSPACGTDCSVDNDCMQCNGAKACNNHKCSECSKTYACPAGQICNLQTGTCEQPCGIVTAPGTCATNADCQGCGGMQNTCHIPLGSSTGTCGPNATGCSDLGQGALALPPPYNQITNTCSDDADCVASMAGIQYNVGEALRDLLGTDSILGQPIDDANIFYPMAACASITLQNTSCGVCVPCRDDDDCLDIDLDALAGDIFPGIGGALIALLFDQLFGPNDHKLYMYCETVAAGYGVCVPCPGLVNDCAPGGPMGGSGTCDHPPTQPGGPLDPACDDCAEEVCGFDPYCCETEWDDICVDEAAEACGTSNCHDVCDAGAPMGDECGTCEGDVCAADPYCCDTSWDSYCIDAAVDLCGAPC
jgi:hypothetical protein